jgi:hypothetical protein
MEGISKRTISLEDQKKLILQGKEVEEINFEGSQLEKQVINKGTNTLICKTACKTFQGPGEKSVEKFPPQVVQ